MFTSIRIVLSLSLGLKWLGSLNIFINLLYFHQPDILKWHYLFILGFNLMQKNTLWWAKSVNVERQKLNDLGISGLDKYYSNY